MCAYMCVHEEGTAVPGQYTQSIPVQLFHTYNYIIILIKRNFNCKVFYQTAEGPGDE